MGRENTDCDHHFLCLFLMFKKAQIMQAANRDLAYFFNIVNSKIFMID
jgi:hypothetical protein